jgi:hypothetical protein
MTSFEKPPLLISPESQESKWGNDVTLDIHLARHGKKASFNAARIDNPDEVQQEANQLDLSDYDYVGVRTTPVERAVDTAQWVREGYENNPTVEQPNGRDIKLRVRQLSSGILSEGGTNIEEILKDAEASKDVNLISPDIRERYKEAVLAAPDSDWDKENAGANAFVQMMQTDMAELPTAFKELESGQEFSEQARQEIAAFKQKQLDVGGISMLEVALRMGSHLEKYVRLTKHLNNDSKVFLYEVNHSGFIEPDLAYLLRDQIESDPVSPDGQSTLEKMGGAFQPSEDVKISIKREGREQPVQVLFGLRGKQYSLVVDGRSDILTRSRKLVKELSVADEVLNNRYGSN